MATTTVQGEGSKMSLKENAEEHLVDHLEEEPRTDCLDRTGSTHGGHATPDFVRQFPGQTRARLPGGRSWPH